MIVIILRQHISWQIFQLIVYTANFVYYPVRPKGVGRLKVVSIKL